MEKPTVHDILVSIYDIVNEAMTLDKRERSIYTKEYVCDKLDKLMLDKSYEFKTTKSKLDDPLTLPTYHDKLKTTVTEVRLYNYPVSSPTRLTIDGDVECWGLSDFVIYNLFTLYCKDYNGRTAVVQDNIIVNKTLEVIKLYKLKELKELENELKNARLKLDKANTALDDFDPFDYKWDSYYDDRYTPNDIRDELNSTIREHKDKVDNIQEDILKLNNLIDNDDKLLNLSISKKLLKQIRFINTAGRFNKSQRMLTYDIDKIHAKFKRQTDILFKQDEISVRDKKLVIDWMDKQWGEYARYHVICDCGCTSVSTHCMRAEIALEHLLLFKQDYVKDIYIVERDYILNPFYGYCDEDYSDEIQTIVRMIKGA